MFLGGGRATITHDVLVFIRPVPILFAQLIVPYPSVVVLLFRSCAIQEKRGWRGVSHHPRGGLGSGRRGTLRGAGAGDEGRTVEDVLLRSLGLAVCTTDFG